MDAGNWQVTDSWTVPTTAVSGVYVANVIDGNQVFQIPFIIRDDNSHSDIVFQTNDETWQAYNPWGGANVYGGNGPGMNGAAYAVSYNRPITTRDGRTSAAEYVQRHGVRGRISHDLLAGAERLRCQLHCPGRTSATKARCCSTIRSTWTPATTNIGPNSQRDNVQAAREAGVNMMFMSGNEIYWQTRLRPASTVAATPNRTMVTYKDTHANRLIDPTGTATGTSWTRVSPRPEACRGSPRTR